jgi:broad specificity phosphatase PhoE
MLKRSDRSPKFAQRFSRSPMTRFAWIRHATTEPPEQTIAGRSSSVSLSLLGRVQAERLARRLTEQKIPVIYSSPQVRARETARQLVEILGGEIRIALELDELDYGEWTGRSLAELEPLPLWRAFNSVRSCTRIPNGELMLEVQARAIGFVERVLERHPGETIGMVTHADVIRAVLAHYLGMPLDLSLRLEVSPGSVSLIALDQHGPRVISINNTEGWL